MLTVRDFGSSDSLDLLTDGFSSRIVVIHLYPMFTVKFSNKPLPTMHKF